MAFYNFNKPPARIFLGDVGSIPIGYLCGLIIIYGMLSFNVFVKGVLGKSDDLNELFVP